MISEKIEEERLIAEKEFAQLLEDFKAKKISGDLLAQIIKKKADESKELERQLREFSRYSVNDATTMALAELQAFKKTVEEQTGVITSLHNQLEEFKQTSQKQEQTIKQLETAKREAEKRIEQNEVEKNITEEKLAQKTKQVLFLQSVESLDVDRILQYHHDIGVHAGTIQNWIDRIAKKIIRNGLSEQELSKIIEAVSRANKKILTISRFATIANFNTTGDTLESDIVGYMVQYVSQILPEVYPNLKFHYNGDDIQYIIKFKPLEVSLMLDNLVSNAIRANAHNFRLEFAVEADHLEIIISDDGKGFWQIIDNPNCVFEKGFTTTAGSGLGLYNISNLITEMGGKITSIKGENNEFKLLIVL